MYICLYNRIGAKSKRSLQKMCEVQVSRTASGRCGPNPARSGNRNNIGDVWVVATHKTSADATPMRARAHLVVTVPLYLRWDFSTVGGR